MSRRFVCLRVRSFHATVSLGTIGAVIRRASTGTPLSKQPLPKRNRLVRRAAVRRGSDDNPH